MDRLNIPAKRRDALFDKILAMSLDERSDILMRIFGAFESTEAFYDIQKIVDAYPNFS